METYIINDLLNKLETFNGKNVDVEIEGFIQAKYRIEEGVIKIKNDIFEMKGKENNVEANINQIYKVESNIDKIKFYMDNDLNITLTKQR